MSDLQTAFYIMGIVFMSISLLLLIGIVTAVFVIRNKIVSLEKMLEQKLHSVTDNVTKIIEVATAAREVARNVTGKK